MSKTKGVIFVIVDSFHPRALRHCREQGKLPALSFLIERGHLDESCVSIFPTMTPACTSTLATGNYPAQHGIPGIVWYHRGERRFVNYGGNLWTTLKTGIKQVATDFFFNLNHRHLGWEVKTIYEDLESRGYAIAAANPFIYRGNTEYEAKVPWTIKLATLLEMENNKIHGPKYLSLGQLHQPSRKLSFLAKDIPFWKKFGFNDKFSMASALWFLQQEKKPDLLTIYLPDTDEVAHKENADCCEPCLTRVDKHLAEILNSFASWDRALEEYTFVIVGDHAQSTLEQGKKAIVNIPEILKEYSQAKLGENPVEGKDIAICSNARTAYVYILQYRPGIRKSIMKLLLEESKVDQVIWKDNEWYHVGKSGKEILSFSRGEGAVDDYGNNWVINGDYSCLDLQVENGKITYGIYPNAMERISGCLDNPNAGDMIVTAHPGYLMGGEGGPVKSAVGNHGSLHREDSLVPLIVSGTPKTIEKPRLVDVVPYIKSLVLSPQV